MTIYDKGCISNYRNCSLCYVCYSVLYRMVTYLPPHVELIYVNVEQGFAGSTGGGTENYEPGDEIEF